MKPSFPITYEVVTAASARHGDIAYSGYLPRSTEVPTHRNNTPKRPALFTLRQVVDLMVPRGNGPIEADCSPCRVPRWLTCQVTDDRADRAISLSVHLKHLSNASARRVARLFGVKLTNP